MRRRFVSVPTQSFESGRYRLEIRVTDLLTGAVATGTTEFVREWGRGRPSAARPERSPRAPDHRPGARACVALAGADGVAGGQVEGEPAVERGAAEEHADIRAQRQLERLAFHTDRAGHEVEAGAARSPRSSAGRG